MNPAFLFAPAGRIAKVAANAAAIAETNNNLSNRIPMSTVDGSKSTNEIFTAMNTDSLATFKVESDSALYKELNLPTSGGIGLSVLMQKINRYRGMALASSSSDRRYFMASINGKENNLTWDEIPLKSDLAGLDATLNIREENGGTLVTIGSKDGTYGMYISADPSGATVNYKTNSKWATPIHLAAKS